MIIIIVLIIIIILQRRMRDDVSCNLMLACLIGGKTESMLSLKASYNLFFITADGAPNDMWFLHFLMGFTGLVGLLMRFIGPVTIVLR